MTEIEKNEDEYIGIEKPIKDCKLTVGNVVYNNVIIWPQSKIAYFMSDIADKTDEANKLNNTFKCINHTFNIISLLNELK